MGKNKPVTNWKPLKYLSAILPAESPGELNIAHISAGKVYLRRAGKLHEI
ncbi:MAG: hypothetical protein JST19_04940 [Bacteroidetes bacterium]|nr:hypothetical protein [Bacteroidota bacterium]